MSLPHSISFMSCPTRLRFSGCQGEEIASEEGLRISGSTRRLQGMVRVLKSVWSLRTQIVIGLS